MKAVSYLLLRLWRCRAGVMAIDTSTRQRVLRCLPVAALLLALSTVFLFSGDRERFYRSFVHDWNSARWLALAENVSPTRAFLFDQATRRANGTVRYDVYNRFPLGGVVLIKLAILPFDGDLSAQILAARWLMLAFFCAAAVLAYCALARLGAALCPVGSCDRAPRRARLVAAAATALAFSSYPMLRYADMINTEGVVDVCAVLLVFHGMVLYEQQGRFAQLLAKLCAALLVGWHVFGLLAAFIALAAAREVVKRRPRNATHLVQAAKQAVRSRHALLVVVAVFLASGVLGFQLANEHAAFGGQRTFTELPNVKSIVKRFGGNPVVNAMVAEELDWRNFLALQFHRVGAMSVPYAVPTPRNALGELPWGAPGDPSLAWVGVGVTAVCFGGLLLLRRGRMLLAVLPVSGFVWALVMRNNTAELAHEFEALFFVGTALVFFALALAGAAKLAGARRARSVVGGLAAVAVSGFVLSSWRMAAAGADPAAAATEHAMMAEFETIRAVVRGEDVLVAASELSLGRLLKAPSRQRRRMWSRSIVDGSGRRIFHYYMAGSVLRYADRLDAPLAAPAPDYVLAFQRLALPSLYTPAHRFAFLYDSPDVLAALVAARERDYRAITAGGRWRLKAQSDWQLRALADDADRAVGRGEAAAQVAFLKQPCTLADAAGRFYLHVRPADSRAGEGERRDDGFVNLPISFPEYGVAFADKCMMRFSLPRWRIGTVRAGQFAPARGPLLWRTAFYLDSERLRRAYRAAQGRRPAARDVFDVHWRDGEVTYLREPCAPSDTQARFFLHVVAADRRDLPESRRRFGFLNLDFDFRERGERQGDHCVALAELPDFATERLRTGQIASAGELWRAELVPVDIHGAGTWQEPAASAGRGGRSAFRWRR